MEHKNDVRGTRTRIDFIILFNEGRESYSNIQPFDNMLSLSISFSLII